MNLRGKTVLITGASKGMGNSIAKNLAKEGANIILVARSEDALKDLVKSLGENHKYYVCDFEDINQIIDLAERVIRDFESLDVLINGAGLGIYKPIEEVSFEEWKKSFSIGLDNADKIAEKIRQAEPYPILKIKLGGSSDEDLIRLIRKITNKPIRCDANEGWKSLDRALQMVDFLSQQGVELVEQPMSVTMIAEQRELKKRSPLPLIADESFQDISDIDNISELFHGINIKIMKSGGLINAHLAFQEARKRSLKTMLGCMIESPVAIHAALQLQGLADWVDLDGCLLIEPTRFMNPKMLNGGWLQPQGPGLGL